MKIYCANVPVFSEDAAGIPAAPKFPRSMIQDDFKLFTTDVNSSIDSYNEEFNADIPSAELSIVSMSVSRPKYDPYYESYDVTARIKYTDQTGIQVPLVLHYSIEPNNEYNDEWTSLLMNSDGEDSIKQVKKYFRAKGLNTKFLDY